MVEKVIVHVVDDSDGFIRKGSDLPVGPNSEGAEELIGPTNAFLAQLAKLPPYMIQFVLFTLDTHFRVEYPLSPESKTFPEIHCSYGSKGWKLAVDASAVPDTIPVFFITKNVFDFWGSNPVAMEKLLAHHEKSSFEELPFENDDERRAYTNLFNVTVDPACLGTGVHRDEFLKNVGPDTTVLLLGVASNFCDADAMYGYLKRGAKVIVMENLVKGIPLPAVAREFLLEAEGIDRTESGEMRDVLKTARFAPFVESGQLTLEHSDDFLRRMTPIAPEPPRPAI